MKPNPLPLLRAISRAVRTDRPGLDPWRTQLVDLVVFLAADGDPAVSLRAVRVLIEMEAANRRLNRIEEAARHC